MLIRGRALLTQDTPPRLVDTAVAGPDGEQVSGLSISAAASRLLTSPRMLRYRERLGLLPPAEDPTQHRSYDEHALSTAAYAMELERTYDVSPSTLAFGLRAVTDPDLAAALRRLARQVGRETVDARTERLRLTRGA